jgi:nucleotide-binding universal stress UspA family protein
MPHQRHDSIFRKILVGYDGSKYSEHAVSVALNLAHCCDAKLLVFAVARPPEPATRVELEAMLDDAREHFEESFKHIQERAKEEDVEIETAIVVGHPTEQIIHRAETDNVDLVVLGHRGVSRFGVFKIGSTSDKVVRHAHCPVMIVR